jgi:hypothetical protein
MATAASTRRAPSKIVDAGFVRDVFGLEACVISDPVTGRRCACPRNAARTRSRGVRCGRWADARLVGGPSGGSGACGGEQRPRRDVGRRTEQAGVEYAELWAAWTSSRSQGGDVGSPAVNR